MSDHTDDILGRYLGQQPGMRKALLTDPVQKLQVEVLRQTLAMMERALADEGVPEDVARRVINRIVWGEPEGLVDAHAQMVSVRKEMLTADLPPDLAQAWQEFPGAGPVRPDEEPTPDRTCPVEHHPGRRCELAAGHKGLHQNNDVFGLQWSHSNEELAALRSRRPDEEAT